MCAIARASTCARMHASTHKHTHCDLDTYTHVPTDAYTDTYIQTHTNSRRPFCPHLAAFLPHYGVKRPFLPDVAYGPAVSSVMSRFSIRLWYCVALRCLYYLHLVWAASSYRERRNRPLFLKGGVLPRITLSGAVLGWNTYVQTSDIEFGCMWQGNKMVKP